MTNAREPATRTADLDRVVAYYTCGTCGNEFILTEGVDYTGIPPQETDHHCPGKSGG